MKRAFLRSCYDQDPACGAIASSQHVLNRSASMLCRIRAITASTAALLLLAAPSLGQEWPSRSVRIVSPFAAGGASDVLGNVIAENLSKRFNHRFLVENQAGRGG